MQTRALALTRAAPRSSHGSGPFWPPGSPALPIALRIVVSLAWAGAVQLPLLATASRRCGTRRLGSALFLVIAVRHRRVRAGAAAADRADARLGLRVAASVLFLVAALGSYFASAYGAVMNQDMMRNVSQTDPAEVGGLISFELLAARRRARVLPAVLVWRVVCPHRYLAQSAAAAALFIVGALALCLVGIVRLLGELRRVLSRAQARPLHAESGGAGRAAWSAVLTRAARRSRPNEPLIDPAGKCRTHRRAGTQAAGAVPGGRRDGACRELSARRLRARRPIRGWSASPDVVYFDHATSCGTSTAISVPCMFSHLAAHALRRRSRPGATRICSTRW